MEIDQKLTDWMLANAGKLSLRVTRLTGIEEWLPGYFDYHIRFSVSGKEAAGRGTDADEARAFLKAASEAVERFACQGLEYPWASATHSDRKQAGFRAYRELLGMDRAMCHHLTGKKVRLLELSVLNNPGVESFLRNACEKHGIKIQLCEMRPSTDSVIAAAYAWNLAGRGLPGVLSGHGVGDSLPEACHQALIECLRKVGPIFINKRKPGEGLPELKKSRSPWWHIWKMSMDPAGLAYLKNELFSEDAQCNGFAREGISAADVSLTEITGFKKIFPDVPCTVMQAYSDKLLRPQFGEAILDRAALARLSAFCSPERYERLEIEIPHMYG